MAHQIYKIEEFEPSNIQNLSQKVIQNRYLVLDLWNYIKDCSGINQRFKQVFLQFNNVKLHSLNNKYIILTVQQC